jgi:hypothetical protein
MSQTTQRFATLASLPPPEMSIRSRREASTRDVENARYFEHWQTDGKAMTNNRPDVNAQAPFHEFQPINSRFVARDYRNQPRFETEGAPLGMNPYFNKYDPNYDSRNAVRELQASVYEDKIVDGGRQNQSILGRQLENRWLNPEQQQEVVEMSTRLRPSVDDFRKVYRPL